MSADLQPADTSRLSTELSAASKHDTKEPQLHCMLGCQTHSTGLVGACFYIYYIRSDAELPRTACKHP